MEAAPSSNEFAAPSSRQEALPLHYGALQPLAVTLQQSSKKPQQYFQGMSSGNFVQYGDDDGDSEDDGLQEAPRATRRKATERPEGSDQKRQAFSKRKRGIALKAYQLYKLTDAKVFMFLVNDKGSSWAYSTPGFGASLHPSQLRRLRELSSFGNPPRRTTEVMPHPRMDETDNQIDDRRAYVGSNVPLVLCHDSDQGPAEPMIDPSVAAARAAAARDRDAQRSMLRRAASTPHSIPPSNLHTPRSAGPSRSAGVPSTGMQTSMPSSMYTPVPNSSMLAPMTSGGMYSSLPSGSMLTPMHSNSMYASVPGGVLTPIMMTADGDYTSETMVQPSGQVVTQMVNFSHMTSSTGLVEAEGPTAPMGTFQEQTQTTNNTAANSTAALSQLSPTLTGMILTDDQGNMYRIVQESLDPSPPNAQSTQSVETYLMSPTVDVIPSGTVMSQPNRNMVHDQATQQPAPAMSAAPISNMYPAQKMPMGPPPPRRPVNPNSPTTTAAATSDSNANKRRAVEGGISEQMSGQYYQTGSAPMTQQAPINVVQAQPTIHGDNSTSSAASVMLANSSQTCMQAGPQMDMYAHHTQYAPATHTQLVQISGPPQRIGGYTMTMPPEMQGYRSYPQGQVMMVSQDWQQGNMGGQQVIMRSMQEQRWQQQQQQY